jgi:cytochrome oxidase Cu insertion factor (SCO1/SenC/PrrC family)
MSMRHADSMEKLALFAFIATLALVIISGTVWGITMLIMHRHQTPVQSATTAGNTTNGIAMSGKFAPDFNLIDQFGHPATLSAMRGHEVVLAFIDSRCTDICPLTANVMYNARTRLGQSAASHISLVAINANPTATSVVEVQSWSIKHGMLHQWLFLTGTAKQLQSVYRQYNLYDQVTSSGAVLHDPAILIIDANGRERLYFETLNSNSQADLGSEESGLEAGMRQWLP